MFAINQKSSHGNSLKVATVTTISAALLICGGVTNLLILIGSSVIFGISVVSYFSRFPVDMYRPTTPQTEKEMNDLQPSVIACCIGAIFYIDAMMLLSASGMVSYEGVTPMKLVIGNVAAVLAGLHVFSLQIPDDKRWTLTLCSSGLLLAFSQIACWVSLATGIN